MAKFLSTTGISYHLEQLIIHAQEKLVIISPYLKVNDRIKELLEDKNRMKIDIRVVYGKNELQPEENNWLRAMTSIRTSFCKDLHAKCYLNEKEAIITSMNLYEFSQVNNNEMGIIVSREDDSALYKEIYEEAQRLIRISEEIVVSVERAKQGADWKTKLSDEPKTASTKKWEKDDVTGYCIRTGAQIPFNVEKPFSADAYKSWAHYKDENYAEKFCHFSGELSNWETSFKKPILRKNWEAAKKVHHL